MSDTIPPEHQKIVNDATEKLLEHFDSVRIFVTRHDGPRDQTAAYDHGGDNFYAQTGQIIEWVDIQRQYSRNYAIRKDAEQ